MATEKYTGHPAHHPVHEPEEETRPCYFCLEGYVYIGCVGPEGEEYTETLKCRRCKGTGVLPRA